MILVRLLIFMVDKAWIVFLEKLVMLNFDGLRANTQRGSLSCMVVIIFMRFGASGLALKCFDLLLKDKMSISGRPYRPSFCISLLDIVARSGMR